MEFATVGPFRNVTFLRLNQFVLCMYACGYVFFVYPESIVLQ